MSFSSFRVISSSHRFLFNGIRQTKLISRADTKVHFKANVFRLYCKESITVTFKLPDGTMVKRSGKVGETVRSVVKEDDPEFSGYGGCMGNVSCGGCHVILSKEDFEKFKEPGETEEDVLNKVPHRTDTSRLACGMELGPEMDGIVLKIPDLNNK